ncbi:30S ribosomal protein S6 [Lujinxingia vulgaris]|uniref:Small ribosomal subunit protein bS6 n=2 Tax=Lujinxingia vulgaris TaxID=2600176 RepID=A0A5C6XGZ4_9DELT|nr:30S ribosomal protein S6 [Lujinxingia vulgaris]
MMMVRPKPPERWCSTGLRRTSQEAGTNLAPPHVEAGLYPRGYFMAVERLREYETIYIVRPDAGEEEFARLRERVEGIIENEGGHLLKFDDWGQRKLAYEIHDKSESRRFERGNYQYYRYLVGGNTVAEIERNLQLIDSVLKFLTVKLEDDLIAEERLARPEEEEIEEVIPAQDDDE